MKKVQWLCFGKVSDGKGSQGERLCKMWKVFACVRVGAYMNMMKYVGVDGCPAGWLAISLTDHNADIAVFSRFSDVWDVHKDAQTIMVDIPMGLPGGSQPQRQADLLARNLLGTRRSTVFLPSVREVLECTTYPEACEVNRQLTGKKISMQYWHLIPKIKDVDSVLQSTPKALDIVREAHPELCFVQASGDGIRFSKKTPEGVEERLAVIEKYVNNINGIYDSTLRKFLRREVARDDIVDAMMLAVTAREAKGELIALPDPPQRDETGLPMAIWCHNFGQ